MAKVRNWSRDKENPDERDFPYVWSHDLNTGLMMVVRRNIGLDNQYKYDVYVINDSQVGTLKVDKNIKRKDRARKIAVRWMKNNSEITLEEWEKEAEEP